MRGPLEPAVVQHLGNPAQRAANGIQRFPCRSAPRVQRAESDDAQCPPKANQVTCTGRQGVWFVNSLILMENKMPLLTGLPDKTASKHWGARLSAMPLLSQSDAIF